MYQYFICNIHLRLSPAPSNVSTIQIPYFSQSRDEGNKTRFRNTDKNRSKIQYIYLLLKAAAQSAHYRVPFSFFLFLFPFLVHFLLVIPFCVVQTEQAYLHQNNEVYSVGLNKLYLYIFIRIFTRLHYMFRQFYAI